MLGRQCAGGWVFAWATATATLAWADEPRAPRPAIASSAEPFDADAIRSGPRLEWLAPPGCPTRQDALAHVATLAASERLRWDRFELIRAVIAHQGSHWSLALELVGGGRVRRRVLQSGRCNELAEAAAVAIVLAHRSSDADEPGATERATLPEGEKDAWTEAGASDAAVTADAAIANAPSAGPARASAVTGDWTLSGRAEAALDPTTLGSSAFGASLGIELGLGAFSTRLYGAGFPSATVQLGTGQSIEFGLWTGGLQGCYRWGRGLDTCALMEVGQVTAQAVGLRQGQQSSDLWTAPGLSVGFRSAPFDRFGITTQVSAFHPLVRGRFRVDDADVVHRVPAIGFRVALGIDLQLL